MAQRIKAFGQILEFPDDMSDDDMLKHIKANEPDLNPDYSPPITDKIKSFARDSLGINTDALLKRNMSIADQAEASANEGENVAARQVPGAPVRQSTYNKALITPDIKGRPGITSRIASAASEDVKGQADQQELELLRTEALKPSESGFMSSAIGTAGRTIKGAGQVGSDFLGQDKDNAITRYGQKLLDDNPVWVKKLEDIKDEPFLAFKEATGNSVGSMAGMIGVAGLGAGITSLSPLSGPAAPVIAAVGQAVQWLGPAAVAALPSYSGIRDAQISKNPKFEDDAKSKAIAAMGAAAVGAIEVAFGPQQWALAMLTKEGRAAMARKFASTSIGEAAIKGTLKGGLTEGFEEIPQNMLEQLASYEDPTTKENVLETLHGGAMGAIGGAGLGGVTAVASQINTNRTQRAMSDIAETDNVDDAIKVAGEAVSKKTVTPDDILKTVDPTLEDVINETQTAEEILTDIVLPDNSSVKAQWRVVDADEIKASMKEGVAQPRDRTRAASDIQIKGIANAPDYRRLSDSPVMDVGAPVIDMDGNIVAGNGRFEGVSQAHDQGTSTEYLNALRQDAITKGIDPAAFEAMRKPILVRQIIEPIDTRKFAIASNSGTTLAMSALEQSKLDAERMKGIENLDVNDLGDIALTPRNLTQLKDSLGDYTSTELGALVDKGGRLSQEGVKRVRNAMLAKAYGASPVLENLVESTDSNMRNVLGALTKSAAHVISTKGDVKPLMDAVSTYSQLKATGQPVDNFLAQQDAFSEGLSPEASEILRFIDANARSQKKLTDFFKGNFREVDTTSADMFEVPKASTPHGEAVSKNSAWVIKNKATGEVLFETFDKAKVKALNTSKYEAVPIYDYLTGLNKDERIASLEKHLKENGYDFTVRPASVRNVDALDSTKKAHKELAEKQAKVFGKKVVFVEADGPFGINGVMVPGIKDTIFVDIRTSKPFHAVMGHELSHWMEVEKPDVYKDMVKSLKTVIKGDAEYAKKYGIDGATKAEITKEIVGDIMGDNFTEQSFWDKVASANPEAFKDIAAAIIKWLKGIIVKAKSNGMGSEEWVKDAVKAQDIVAQAVAKYTGENKATAESKPKFHKAFHGSPHDHSKFDSTKIGTGEGAQAYGYGHYFAESKDVAEFYKGALEDSNLEIDGKSIPNISGGHRNVDVIEKLLVDNYKIDEKTASHIALAFNKASSKADVLKWMNNRIEMYRTDNSSEAVKSMSEVKATFESLPIKIEARNTGKLYEVELAPEQDEYLLWDEPLSEQSDKVKEALGKLDPDSYSESGDDYDPTEQGQIAYHRLSNSTGYDQIKASEKLRSLGIRGIKYLDGSSRAKGAGAYNYVIFDDKDIDIKAKFSRDSKGKPLPKSFFDWFENSKVVDDQGRPLVVYHGTSKDIEVFEPDSGKGKTFGTGSFFSSNPLTSNTYTGGINNGNVLPVYLNMQNPAVFDAQGANWNRINKNARVSLPKIKVSMQRDENLLAELEGRAPDQNVTRTLRARNTTLGRLLPNDFKYVDDYGSTDDLARWARQQGYDGLIIKNVRDQGPTGNFVTEESGKPGTIYVAYKANQVKSATGNNGDFSKTDNRIHFSRSPLRLWMPVPRSPGWTEEKIIRALKSKAWSRAFGKSTVLREIAKFDSSKEFADHIYYHGTGSYVANSLVPSIAMSEAEAERSGGGGYGERYWAISLSKSKEIASNFTAQSNFGTVYGVILKKGANVQVVPGIQDAADIEDHIVQLWDDGVDAVDIGGGEQELAVLNPAAIIRYENGENFGVFKKKKFEPLTTEQVEDIYKKAKGFAAAGRGNMEVPEIKFSKQEIENTLIAQHNLTIRNLIHADRMGGLAVPSIAVTDKAHPLTGFGEITLLSTKDMVDPENGTKIFGSDIYSPRYPSISYDFSGKPIKALNNLLAEGVKATGDSEYYNDSLENDPFRELLHSSAAMYQFLSEQGKTPDIKFIEPKALPDPRLEKFVDSKLDSFDLSKDAEFKATVKEVFSDLSDRDHIDDEGLGYVVRDYAEQVVAHRDAIRNAGKVDRTATNSRLFRQISDSNLRNKFDEYLVDLVNKSGPKERIFKGYTNAGNRQYMPHDIDTVIKMLKKDLRGGENFKYGLGSIRAKYSPQFKSIEQIRKSKGMLMDSESFDRVKKEVQTGLDDLNESLSSYGTFSGYDNVETMLSDVAKRGINGALKDNGFENVPDSIKVDIQTFINKLKDMPTEYFEAKILRAVGLGEFSTAIIPDDATPQAEAILKKNGIEDIRKYKAGDNEDRVKQINAVTHVMFSRAPKLYSKLEQALESANDKVFSTGQQVKLWLQGNAGKLGIKKDEIYWSGIDNWLDAQGKVSKQQVVEFVRNNGVRVEDVVLDNSAQLAYKAADIPALRRQVASEVYKEYITDKTVMSYEDAIIKSGISEDADDWALPMHVRNIKTSIKDGFDKLINNQTVEFKPITKKVADMLFGTDYKTVFESASREYYARGERLARQRIGNNNDEPKHNNSNLTLPGGTDYKELVITVPTVEKYNESDDTHFGNTGQGKQIGWLRMNTRDGGLFIEELQSQRAQQGRSEGFNVVPPAPFVSDANNKATNAYITLLMKKAVIEAVSNDHVSVSWTTGDQQADRYDLSKQIERIYHKDNKDGTYSILADTTDSSDVTIGESIPRGELPSYVGKDVANKILNAEGTPAKYNEGYTMLKGVDLKTGGEWAQSMYGDERGLNLQGKPSLMSQAANDIFKHVGSGKVESINGQPGFYITDEMRNKDLPLFSRIMVDGVERPTTNSEGKAINNPVNFWKWFGDDANVDDQGRPKVLYHSTLEDIAEFDSTGEFMGYSGTSGISLTDNRDMASRYLDRFGERRYDGVMFQKNVMPVYAKIGKFIERNEPFRTNVRFGAPLPENYIPAHVKLGYDTVIRNDSINRKGSTVKHSDAKNALRGKEYIIYGTNRIKSAIGNNGDYSLTNNDIRFSFAGPKAETADKYALDTAQQRIAAGDPEDTVRQETGWFKGVDGKWRFEINDTDASIKKPFPTKGQRFGDVYESVYKQRLKEGYAGIALSDMLDHPKLFAAYPHLEDLSIDTQKGAGASYRVSTSLSPSMIEIGEDVPMFDVLSTLLHEIQHGIQSIEGFATGGSVESARRVAADIVTNKLNDINSRIIELGANRSTLKGDEYLKNVELHKSLVKERDALTEQLESLKYDKAPAANAYKRLAGEVEARNTQTRMGFSDEERRLLPPYSSQDVPDSDQIIVYNGTEMRSEPERETVMVDGIERPTTNSEGEPIKNPVNFWKWFGDSKVIDGQGRPKVFYHGSSASDINTFDPSMSRDVGIHFSESDISDKFGGNKYAAYLRITNPESILDIFSIDGSGYGVYSKQVPGAIDVALDLLSDQSEKLYELGAKIEKSWVDDKEVVNINSKAYKLFWKEVLKLAKSEGVDGFEYKNKYEGGGVSYVVFNSNQIKSTTDNNGDYSLTNNDIRFSKATTPPDETRLRRFQRMNQDNFNRFTVIRNWLKEQGIKLSDKADVYGAEERYHSKTANQLEDFREQQRNPLIEKIQKAGYTLGDIEVFLKMQHAQEANAQIRTINDNPDATAYGITDEEASEYLAEAPKELTTLANELRDITEQTKKLRLDNGILNTDITDAWEGAYQHYIPVKGEADAERGVGKGLKTNFKSKRRLGHSLRDEHVIENILMDHERAIMEVERNRIGKHLVMMAAEMQRPDILSIDKPEKRKVLKVDTAYTVEANGVVQGVFKSRDEAKMFKQLYATAHSKVAPSAITINQTKDQRVIASASPMLADNEVNVYMNGHAIRVQINDEWLARAYTKLGVEQFSGIVAAGQALSGYLSKVYTGYAPEFIVKNMIRDFSSGTINLTGEQGFGMTLKSLANYPKAFGSLLKYAVTNGKSSNKWIDSYRANGGNTGAAYLSDMERLGNEVSTEYASHQGVLSNLKQGDNMNAARAVGRKVFNATLKWIYNLNQAGENAMRLAAFKAMIESGKTVNEAAKVAKNITVNFNRRGERRAIPALYLFYNASIQGTAATAHALFKGKHKYQAQALAASMATVGYLVASSFGGGSEDDWDEMNDYDKERNLLIKSGDGYVKIPVPYGYGFFYNLGRTIADTQRTGDLGAAPWHLATSAISEFTPFNDVVVGSDGEFKSDQVFMGFLPTAFKIVVQPIFNKQLFTGSELMPESQNDKSQPDREKMFRSTKGTIYDEIAGWLESAGLEEGISPETLKYIVRTGTGGAGSFVDTTISAAMLKKEGAELDTGEIPFVRIVYMELSIKDRRAAFYKAQGEAREAAEKFNRIKRKNDVAKLQEFVDNGHNLELLQLNDYANKVQKWAGLVRDEQDAIRADENLNVKEKRLKLKELEAQESEFYKDYLDVFKTHQ